MGGSSYLLGFYVIAYDIRYSVCGYFFEKKLRFLVSK